MKQAIGYLVLEGRRDVVNELSLVAQAIWHLSSRSIAGRMGLAKRGRCQARYIQREM
jgi:hypothetical protein